MLSKRGNWTPVLKGLSGGVAVATVAAGIWVNEGGIVHASCRIVVPSVAGLSGQLCIEGFPVANLIGYESCGRAAGHFPFWGGLSLGSGNSLVGFMQDSLRLRLYAQSATSGGIVVTPAMVSGQLTLYLSVTYICEEPTEFEKISWNRESSPVFEKSSNPTAFDHETAYGAVINRNLDRSPYVDYMGTMQVLYSADNTVGTDYDQAGLALLSDINTWSRYGTAPVIATAPSTLYAGDVQPTSVWQDGGETLVFAQINATPPGDLSGDNVTVGLFSSMNHARPPYSFLGQVLGKGSGTDGDASDIYRPKLVPIGHDGKPKLFYTGKDAAGNFGLMVATSPSGDIRGSWVKMGSAHIHRHGTMFIEDAWYEDGLYHFVYIIGGSTPGGLWYATSPDAATVTTRRQILPRRSGYWDSSPTRGSYVEIGGVKYLLFDGGGSVGIGYAAAI